MHNPLVRALSNPALYDHPVESVRLIETHISWVLLTGDYAYKIKKPVKLPFVDFSTLKLRHEFCEEELRLNRRLAPEIYLAVVPIGGSAEEPALYKQPAIEYAVKLRQFSDGARLDEYLKTSGIAVEDIAALAESIARFHAALPPVQEYGSAGAIIDVVTTNLEETRQALDSPEHAQDLDTLKHWLTESCADLAETLTERHASGAIRECHGDLHLENLAYWQDRIVAFDALEFDPALRCMDVLDEAAFLVMDLATHSELGLACEFLNRYLEIGGDYAGLSVFRLYLVHRALVRAKVAEIKLGQRLDDSRAVSDVADRYFRCALDAIGERTPRLLITHGLSGSGKTTITNALISRLPAIRCRSDLERKRLHGLAPDARTGSAVGGGLYDASSSDATYARLRECAASSLRAGLDVIVDAAFLRRSSRDSFRQLAEDAGAAYAVLDCSAPEAELRRRIEARLARHADASEATLAVLESQLATQEPLSPEELEHTVSVNSAQAADYDALAEQLKALQTRSTDPGPQTWSGDPGL